MLAVCVCLCQVGVLIVGVVSAFAVYFFLFQSVGVIIAVDPGFVVKGNNSELSEIIKSQFFKSKNSHSKGLFMNCNNLSFEIENSSWIYSSVTSTDSDFEFPRRS